MMCLFLLVASARQQQPRFSLYRPMNCHIVGGILPGMPGTEIAPFNPRLFFRGVLSELPVPIFDMCFNGFPIVVGVGEGFGLHFDFVHPSQAK